MVLGTGAADEELLSEEASAGVRAFWCERYDAFGNAKRIGPYRELYANGQIRLEATYVKAGETTRLEGPVEIRNDDGSPFLRGFLKGGEWAGDLVIFHETGEPWFEGNFKQGRLDGPLRTHHADGALESETRFSRGGEHGLARSFFAPSAGGRLKSEVRVESDQIVGAHRVLDSKGELRREFNGNDDWNDDGTDWQAAGVPRTTRLSSLPAEIPSEAAVSHGLDEVWPIGDALPVGPATASATSTSAATYEELDASN